MLAFALLAGSQAHTATVLQLQQGAYASDAQAYFNALSIAGCATPSVAFKQAVSTYVYAEIAAGNWGGQDFAYVTTTADQCTASVNLAQSTLYNVTYSGGCTFSVANGLNGDGATCVGSTGVTPATLMRYTQNNAHLGVCVGGTSGVALGVNTAPNQVLLGPSTNKSTRLNAGASVVDTNGGGAGCHYADRINSSTVINTGKNGVVQSSGVASASSSLSTATFTLCESNGTFCTSLAKVLFVEAGQPISNELTHYNDLRTMLIALGAQGL